MHLLGEIPKWQYDNVLNICYVKSGGYSTLVYDRNRKFGRNFRIQQFSVYEREVGTLPSYGFKNCIFEPT